MRISIREGVFETNSSSVHAIVVMTGEEYDRWQNEKTYINLVDELDGSYPRVVQWPEFVSEESALDISKEFGWQEGIEDIHNLLDAGQIPYDIIEKVASGKDMYPLVNAFLVKYDDWVGKPMVQLQVIIEN